jgi:hypothetical protein
MRIAEQIAEAVVLAECALPAMRAASRTCSMEAEIRRHCAFEEPIEINSGGYRRIFLPISTISIPDSAGVIPFLTSR